MQTVDRPYITTSIDLDRVLADRFGFTAFRPLQREVIRCLLAGESALAVLPTGGGKSLCYQLPALLLPGATLVISPLISLMKDQVDGLVTRGIAAVAINSQDTLEELREKLADFASGRAKLVYVAPERLRNPAFLSACRQARIGLLAVDEAHCVSQWGHDFRPDYRSIRDFRAAIGNPPLLALTATATRRVKEDIVALLGIERARRFEAGVDRPNLWLGVDRCASVAEKRGKLVAYAARSPGSTIVYVSSRKDAEDVAALLEAELGEPVAAYHAGMDAEARSSVQTRFMAGMLRVVTATNAFGMGIDKPDIRAVIHAGIPESIEAYYQEVGRAGRDGAPSECTMVVVPGMDVRARQYLLEKDEPTYEQVRRYMTELDRLRAEGCEVIPLAEGSAALGLLVLSHLQALGALEIVQRTSAGVQVRFLGNLGPEAASPVWSEIQQHVWARRDRFRRMRNFVYLETCRRRFLLQYFGDDPQSLPSGCCSACSPVRVDARPLSSRPGATGPHARRAGARRQTLGRTPGHSVASLPTGAVDPGTAPGSAPVPDPVLLERLKAWRRGEARERDVPAYVIFGDRDLEAIAAAVPRNLDELAACRGVGPTKLKLYGGAVLSIVWETLLGWVATAPDETWKPQVRRFLRPETYLAIRAAVRERRDEPLAAVEAALADHFDPKEIELTCAVMRRVGELSR